MTESACKYKRTPESDVRDGGFLTFMYDNAFGSLTMRFMTRPVVSRAAGAFLDSPISKPMIKSYIKHSGVDMEQYESTRYRSYNDFFTRKIKPEYRSFKSDPELFLSPCDSKLLIYRINEKSAFNVKGFTYTVDELFSCRGMGEEYSGGYCMVFRLDVSDYHHYYYIDDGVKGENMYIGGRLHTVRPIAQRKHKIFAECCREYTVIDTVNFGRIVQMEVGAMMVGRICNLDGAGRVSRGSEKGYFEFGGSTVVILAQSSALEPEKEILVNTREGYETHVKAGDIVGHKL